MKLLSGPPSCDRVRKFLDTVMYHTIVCCDVCHGAALSYEIVIPEIGSDPLRICCHILDVISLHRSGVRSFEDVSCDTKTLFHEAGLFKHEGTVLRVVDVDAVARKLTEDARESIRKGQFS